MTLVGFFTGFPAAEFAALTYAPIPYPIYRNRYIVGSYCGGLHQDPPPPSFSACHGRVGRGESVAVRSEDWLIHLPPVYKSMASPCLKLGLGLVFEGGKV